MIMIFSSVSVPSYWFSRSSRFSLFSSPLILFKLKSVPAVCHNDTISASRPPSLRPLFQLPLTLSVSVSVSFPLTRLWTGTECRFLSLCKIFFPTLSLPLSLSSMLVRPIQPPHCGSWSAFLLQSSFTLGYNVEIRLSVPFYFSRQLHCFGLSLSLSQSPSSLLVWTQCCFLYNWPLTLTSHLQ